MQPPSSVPYKSPKRRYLLLAAAIVIVIVAWTGAWFYGRSFLSEQIDLQIADLSESGVGISCSNRQIGGYPFRYEVRCQNPALQDRFGAAGEIGALTGVAMVYNPGHIILEAEAPAVWNISTLSQGGEVLWETARSSLKIGTSGLGDVDVAITQPEIRTQNALGSFSASAANAQLHLREAPDQKQMLEAYVSFKALNLTSVPGFPAGLDGRAHLRLEDGTLLLAGSNLAGLIQTRGAPLPIELALAEINSGKSRFGAQGDLVLNGNGTLSGTLQLTLTQPEEALNLIEPLFAGNGQGFSILDGLLRSLKPTAKDLQGDPAVSLPLIIDQGVMRIGFVTLGVIPPLFQAGI